MTLQQLLSYAVVLYLSSFISRLTGISELATVIVCTLTMKLMGVQFNNHILDLVAHIFVVLTMYNMGTHISRDKLIKKRNKFAIALAFSGVMIVPFVIIAKHFFKFNEYWLMISSVVLLVSSTPIANKLLIDSGDFASEYGQLTFINLIVQDLLLILMIGAHAAGVSSLSTALALLIKMILQLLVAFMIRETNLHHHLKNNFSIIFVFIFCFCIMDYLKVDYELAAFLIGMALPKKKVTYVVNDVNSVLVYMFLISSISGLQIDLITLKDLRFALWVFSAIALVKMTFCYLMARFAGNISILNSLKLGASLLSITELAFFVLESNETNLIHLMGQQTFFIVTIFSILASPTLFSILSHLDKVFTEQRLGFAIKAAKKQLHLVKEKVIVIGFGQLGSHLYTRFEDEKIFVIAIDHDVKKAYLGHSHNKKVFFMDGLKSETYYALSVLRGSNTIISTLRDLKANAAIVTAAKSVNVDCSVIVPCIHHEEYLALHKLGGKPFLIDHETVSNAIFDFCTSLHEKHL